jgi:hypothetical protein
LFLLNEKTGREGKPVKIPEQTEAAKQCGCHTIQVYRVSKQYAREGLERVLNRKKRETPPVPAKATGEIEAKIIAASCGGPPAGYSRRTLRLLEEKSKAVLGIELSDTARGNVLKKTPLKPHLADCRRIAPKENAAFVAASDEYVRKGACSVFMFVEPLGGRGYASASRQRTGKDWAREMKPIVKEQYPDAEKAVLGKDNTNLRFENTHTVPSLYEAFPAAEAFELARKLEIHYTPKHGSWFNIAEIELSAMSSQCLDRRIDRLEKLQGELGV